MLLYQSLTLFLWNIISLSIDLARTNPIVWSVTQNLCELTQNNEIIF